MLVDHAALVRGHTVAGEACEIEGLGPVPVSVVESWRHDAYLRLIVTDGIDVKAITRRSRYIDAHQDAALAGARPHLHHHGLRRRLAPGARPPGALRRGHTTALDGLGRYCAGGTTCSRPRAGALVGGPGCYRRN